MSNEGYVLIKRVNLYNFYFVLFDFSVAVGVEIRVLDLLNLRL